MADQETIAAANPPTAPTKPIPDKPVPDQFEGLRVRAVNFAKAVAAPMAAEVDGIKELGRQAVQQVTDPQKRLDLVVGMAQPGEMGPGLGMAAGLAALEGEGAAELGTAAKSLFEGLRVRLADTPTVHNVNGSGESAASQEAISRLGAEKSSSTQRVKIDTRSGRETPLIGVDAVDAKVQPHEVIVMRTPKGETLVDKGATARYTPNKNATLDLGGAEMKKKPKAPETIPQAVIEDYVGRQHQVADELLSEYNGAIGKKGYKQNWDLVPAGRMKKIWNDYATLGFVRDEKGIDQIADVVSKNIHKIEVNNILTGHTPQTPEGYAEDIVGEKIPEGHFEKNESFFDDEKGNWRISDYAADKLSDASIELMRAKTSEQKLQIIDRILNIVHQRSDLAGWFVEGGHKTLSELSGRPSTKIANKGAAKLGKSK